jgi:hypothetical protein
MLERGGRDMMAFVSDDKTVPGGQLGDVVAAGPVCKVTTSMEPRSLAWPPPSCPALTPRNSGILARHCSASDFPSTRTSVET